MYAQKIIFEEAVERCANGEEAEKNLSEMESETSLEKLLQKNGWYLLIFIINFV